jgi:hypothetical protein
MMSDLSQHFAFTAQITHFAVAGMLWEHSFSTVFFGQCFVDLFVDFKKTGCSRGIQNRRRFSGENVLKFDPVAKKLPWDPRRAQELPNDAKMLPKKAKMMSQGPRNCSFCIATMVTGT